MFLHQRRVFSIPQTAIFQRRASFWVAFVTVCVLWQNLRNVAHVAHNHLYFNYSWREILQPMGRRCWDPIGKEHFGLLMQNKKQKKNISRPQRFCLPIFWIHESVNLKPTFYSNYFSQLDHTVNVCQSTMCMLCVHLAFLSLIFQLKGLTLILKN